MKNKQLVREWIKRAQSNLVRAKEGKTSELIVYEDLVFDCQQAPEKALKSLLLSIDIKFPSTHSIARLIELLLLNKVDVPIKVQDSVFLTEYAVITRYPGIYEQVTEIDYQEALVASNNVLNWVTENIGNVMTQKKEGSQDL